MAQNNNPPVVRRDMFPFVIPDQDIEIATERLREFANGDVPPANAEQFHSEYRMLSLTYGHIIVCAVRPFMKEETSEIFKHVFEDGTPAPSLVGRLKSASSGTITIPSAAWGKVTSNVVGAEGQPKIMATEFPMSEAATFPVASNATRYMPGEGFIFDYLDPENMQSSHTHASDHYPVALHKHANFIIASIDAQT